VCVCFSVCGRKRGLSVAGRERKRKREREGEGESMCVFADDDVVVYSRWWRCLCGCVVSCFLVWDLRFHSVQNRVAAFLKILMPICSRNRSMSRGVASKVAL
jgi:hypothetical protein